MKHHNCPSVRNADQLDTDEDLVGDACDTCPRLPNGASSLAGQEGCAGYAEVEPNDAPGAGVSIQVPSDDTIVSLVGTVEAAAGSTQAVDRYQLQVSEAETLVEIEVNSDGALEPYVEATGGPWIVERSASGSQRAARQLFFPLPGTYELTIADRRGIDGVQPMGGAAFGYVVEFRRTEVVKDHLGHPLFGVERRFDYQLDEGEILFFRVGGPTRSGYLVSVHALLSPDGGSTDPLDRDLSSVWRATFRPVLKHPASRPA